MLVGRCARQRVDVRPDGEPESSEGNGHCDAQRSGWSRAPQPEALVGNVSRIRHGTDPPRRQPPHAHVTGRRGEHDTHQGVDDADGKDGADPLSISEAQWRKRVCPTASRPMRVTVP